ncbi:MAG: hypothetical protein INR65_06330 [Gluconacetobacter diazotrophicus]|nr:hypothetical protein [Gluconacetobacter diazotrophicus]
MTQTVVRSLLAIALAGGMSLSAGAASAQTDLSVGSDPSGSSAAAGGRSEQSTVSSMAPGAAGARGTVTHLLRPGLPSANANQSIRDTNTPVFQVAGFNGYVTAPVIPAYDADNNLRTFAGQPGRGSTAVLQQGMYGTP